jgi:sugar diacid utilization regulator
MLEPMAKSRRSTSSAAGKSAKPKPSTGGLEGFGAVSAAVESGAGLPAVVRAAAALLESSLAVIDSSSAVLAVAAASPEDERRLLSGEGGSTSQQLTVAERQVGVLRVRPRSAGKTDPAALKLVATLISLEVERALAPQVAGQDLAGGFVGDLIERRVSDPDVIRARAEELGVDIAGGCAFVLVRATPRKAVAYDWRARLQLVVERTVRHLNPHAVTAGIERSDGGVGEAFVLLPGGEAGSALRAAKAIHDETESALGEFGTTIGFGRVTHDPGELFRACQEALLAVNVAEAGGVEDPLSFEETGAYRLLLPVLCDDPEELRRFYAETIEPLAAYDDQYESALVRTLETFLATDGSIARTAGRLFTHRHTIRYRLERVKDITGLDSGSTDGRERLSLGLKAMRVLGIADPGGPAQEAGAEGGRVPGP